MKSRSAALAARGIAASLGGTPVLRGIDVDLASGCWTSIVGPNGAGKSTLLKVLAHLLPHEGQVTLAGRPVAQMPARMRARQISWLGQHETSGLDLTVYDVTMLGRLPHQSWLATVSALDEAAVERALRATQAW
ncbi:MAG: ABC transporter ATP-binding protein, partial [Rhodoferax sp.]|nr:ABC transporter ATP-binding protein [Rhodoferax sp.]